MALAVGVEPLPPPVPWAPTVIPVTGTAWVV